MYPGPGPGVLQPEQPGGADPRAALLRPPRLPCHEGGEGAAHRRTAGPGECPVSPDVPEGTGVRETGSAQNRRERDPGILLLRPEAGAERAEPVLPPPPRPETETGVAEDPKVAESRRGIQGAGRRYGELLLLDDRRRPLSRGVPPECDCPAGEPDGEADPPLPWPPGVGGVPHRVPGKRLCGEGLPDPEGRPGGAAAAGQEEVHPEGVPVRDLPLPDPADAAAQTDEGDQGAG